MKLDSVRSLKAELSEGPVAAFAASAMFGSTAVARGATSRAAFTSEVQKRSGVALGIARGHKKSDFKLAIRIKPSAVAHAAAVVEQLHARAKGEVDVRYLKRVVAFARPAKASAGRAIQSKVRPICIGASIGYVSDDFNMAGTLGCFVRDRQGRLCILSNNHVLAQEGLLPKGSPILQPGELDGGQSPRDVVGKLQTFVPFKFNPKRNVIDCAIALVAAGIKTDLTTISGFKVGLTGVRPASDPILPGEPAHKFGRTTGYRKGSVSAIELNDLQVGYERGSVWFNDQIEIEGDSKHFSDAGDSGSIIVDAKGRAFALLFAGDDDPDNPAAATFANPIQRVLQTLKVTLAT